MLAKRGNLLVAAKGGRTVLEQRLWNLEGVAVFGNVQISTQALEMLLASGIEVSYFSYSGKFLGHLTSDESKNIFLRLAQYDIYQDEERRLAIARTIVDNKISNQIAVIRSHPWTTEYNWEADVAEIERIRAGLWEMTRREKEKNGQKEADAFEEILRFAQNDKPLNENGQNDKPTNENGQKTAEGFEGEMISTEMLPGSEKKEILECKGGFAEGNDQAPVKEQPEDAPVEEKSPSGRLLGIEGICSRIYFRTFGAMFLSELRFEKRSRRPPKDPVNVILSLAYTMLTKEVESALSMASFEVSLGFLHGVRYGRKSLALDIVEEFRQPLADRLVLKIFNQQMLTVQDFEFVDDGVVLTEDGFRGFFRAYEKWMNGSDSTSGVDSFRVVIRKQVDKLKKAVQNGTVYEPFVWEE